MDQCYIDPSTLNPIARVCSRSPFKSWDPPSASNGNYMDTHKHRLLGDINILFNPVQRAWVYIEEECEGGVDAADK